MPANSADVLPGHLNAATTYTGIGWYDKTKSISTPAKELDIKRLKYTKPLISKILVQSVSKGEILSFQATDEYIFTIDSNMEFKAMRLCTTYLDVIFSFKFFDLKSPSICVCNDNVILTGSKAYYYTFNHRTGVIKKNFIDCFESKFLVKAYSCKAHNIVALVADDSRIYIMDKLLVCTKAVIKVPDLETFCFSDDGLLFYCSTSSRHLLTYDTTTALCVNLRRLHEQACSLSINGDKAIIGMKSGIVQMLDVVNNTSCESHLSTSLIEFISFSNELILTSGTKKRSLKFYDLNLRRMNPRYNMADFLDQITALTVTTNRLYMTNKKGDLGVYAIQ